MVAPSTANWFQGVPDTTDGDDPLARDHTTRSPAAVCSAISAATAAVSSLMYGVLGAPLPFISVGTAGMKVRPRISRPLAYTPVRQRIRPCVAQLCGAPPPKSIVRSAPANTAVVFPVTGST